MNDNVNNINGGGSTNQAMSGVANANTIMNNGVVNSTASSMAMPSTPNTVSTTSSTASVPVSGKSTSNDMIYCSNCGAPMNSNARCCLRCGSMNVVNEENANFIGVIDAQKNNPREEISQTNYNNPKSFLICTIITSFIYLGIMGFFSFAIFLNQTWQFMLPIAFLFSILFLELYSFELIFMDSNHPWWAVFVPLYNTMVLSDIVMDNMYIGLIFYALSGLVVTNNPIFVMIMGFVELVVTFIVFFNIGSKYEKNPFLTAIFPSIVIPFIAYSSYTGFVDETDASKTQRNRMIKNCYFYITSTIVIVGFLFIFYRIFF